MTLVKFQTSIIIAQDIDHAFFFLGINGYITPFMSFCSNDKIIEKSIQLLNLVYIFVIDRGLFSF